MAGASTKGRAVQDTGLDELRQLFSECNIKKSYAEEFSKILKDHGYSKNDLELLCSIRDVDLIEMGITKNAAKNIFRQAVKFIATKNAIKLESRDISTRLNLIEARLTCACYTSAKVQSGTDDEIVSLREARFCLALLNVGEGCSYILGESGQEPTDIIKEKPQEDCYISRNQMKRIHKDASKSAPKKSSVPSQLNLSYEEKLKEAKYNSMIVVLKNIRHDLAHAGSTKGVDFMKNESQVLLREIDWFDGIGRVDVYEKYVSPSTVKEFRKFKDKFLEKYERTVEEEERKKEEKQTTSSEATHASETV